MCGEELIEPLARRIGSDQDRDGEGTSHGKKSGDSMLQDAHNQ
jgi:hypothetical protein